MQYKMLLKTDDSHVKTVEKKKINIINTFKMCGSELKKNKNFASFLALLFFFYMSWQMAWPMFFIFVVEYAGANEFIKNTLDFSGVILFALTATWWGKYIQKNGAKKAGVIGFFSSALSPAWLVLWSSYAGLFANYIFGGLFSAALHLGMFNDMLEQLPKENRTFNIGIYNTVTQISAFIAPLIGVSIYRATNIKFVMILSSSLRAIAAILFLIRYLKSKKKDAVEINQN